MFSRITVVIYEVLPAVIATRPSVLARRLPRSELSEQGKSVWGLTCFASPVECRFTRTPGLSDRLRDCWWDLEDLHREIECVIFDRPVCPVTVELFLAIKGWFVLTTILKPLSLASTVIIAEAKFTCIHQGARPCSVRADTLSRTGWI